MISTEMLFIIIIVSVQIVMALLLLWPLKKMWILILALVLICTSDYLTLKVWGEPRYVVLINLGWYMIASLLMYLEIHYRYKDAIARYEERERLKKLSQSTEQLDSHQGSVHEL